MFKNKHISTSKILRAINNQYKINNIYRHEEYLLYQSKKYEFKSKKWYKKPIYFLYKMFFGYGEKWYYPLVSAILLILFDLCVKSPSKFISLYH